MFHKARLDHHFCQRVFLFPDLVSYIYFPPKVNSLLTSPGQVCSAMAKLGALEYFYNYYHCCCFHYFYIVVPPLRKSKSINKNKTKSHQNYSKNTHTKKQNKIVTFRHLRCSATPQEERPRWTALESPRQRRAGRRVRQRSTMNRIMIIYYIFFKTRSS